MADKKKISVHTFTGGANSDIADQFIKADMFRKMLNMRVYGTGTSGVPTKIPGNTLIPNILPAGNNKGHGWAKNEETGKLYFINYNDQGYHGIYAYDILTGGITPVLLNITDTNGEDIMKLDPNYPIYHFDIVSNKLAYWVDGKNKARKTNILKCIDKSSAGYGTVITEDFITAYKQCGVYAPTVAYFTDLTRSSNYLYGLQFKFTYRWYYDDGEVSNAVDFSAVALPPNESYLGATAITFDNNGIAVTVETGSKLVTKIEILVQINDQKFVSCIVLNKEQLGINSYATYTYQFFNDGAYVAVENLKIYRPYSYLPNRPYAQAFVKTALLYANFYEGFSPVKILGSANVSYKPFYLPSGTVSQLNNPLLTTNLLSANEHGGIFNSWWTTVTRFEVGSDVKKGNVFTIICTGGNTSPSSPQNFSYVATISDTAETVASQIKAYLRLIDAVGTGSIINESTDGSGNVLWDFEVEAHESKQPIKFNGSVTPVNYSTLLDNGLSINTIKQGGTRKYGVVYEDDDGRTSLTYTNDALLVRTLFETETLLGSAAPIGLQQPIHTITISNRPPIWAKYWRLVRTEDIREFIQLLIQQVNTVAVANQDTYLDMVVGSLFTYQQIHPDTILQYEFKRGDRLRLISNENTTPPTLYTPYFETEILGYSVDTEEFVNANIIVDGTAEVQPGKAVDPNYIGKSIVINGAERIITGISGPKYVLDHELVPNVSYQGGASTATTYPNYTFIDRRGIIRIKKPPVGYNVVSQSLVEIYRPQQNIDNSSYLNFLDFQQKFPIINPGTANAAHIGNIQNQDPADPIGTPVIVQVTQGDAYVRNRAMPSNNQNPNPQVIVDQICDPNFSDFYKSNLYSTGRVYPQDQAYGEVYFGSRVRFSNNYIEDTRINGLNDYDNTDREDYYDPYGNITLLRFKRQYLRLFKQLKTAWTPILQRIVKDNAGAGLLTSSDKLLNDLEYAVWEGGIGNNPESYCENGNSEYIVSVDSGVIIRIAQDGSIPISTIYGLDKDIRALLADVSKYKLKIPGGFEKAYNDAIWSVDDYIKYLYNNNFNAGDWQTVINQYPEGTTWVIVQQPANSVATVDGGQITITDTSVLGSDYFKFKGILPAGGGETPVMNFCFVVVAPVERPTGWRIREDDLYCNVYYSDGVWLRDGNQSSAVLEEYYLDDNSLTGRIMPNISTITNDVIIPSTNDITVNIEDAVAPTGGSNGDVWYNFDGDALYKKVAGVWSLISGRLTNAFYQSGVQNLTACPLPILYESAEIDSDYQRDNCDPGYEGTTVHINIPAGTYTSYVSQSDADDQAEAAAQEEANAEGSCVLVYQSAPINANYRRNDCGAGQTGTFVYVSLPLGAYTSITSQIDADNQAQAAAQAQANSEGSCLYDATISTVLVEYLTDTNADLCMFVQTPALDESGIIVTGTALTPSGPLLRPDDGTDPSNCYLLSSDKLGSTSPAWRFGINIAYFVQKYAGVLTSITFRMQGRDTVAGACSIRYAPRPVTEGYLQLVGSTGARIPAVSAGSSIPTTVGSNITSGANGTVGTGVGSPVFDIIYTFRVGITPDSISVTTY